MNGGPTAPTVPTVADRVAFIRHAIYRIKHAEARWSEIHADPGASSAEIAWARETRALSERDFHAQWENVEAVLDAVIPELFPVSADAPIIISRSVGALEFRISDANGEALVQVHPDGRVTLHPKLTVDEAARTFWEAVERCRQEQPQ
jgi:hypothetical protein